jgi:hypothetical protein
MADSGPLLGAVALVAEGILFAILNELPLNTKPEIRKWLRVFSEYLAATPTQESRESHLRVALGLIAGIVLAFVPWGFGVMDSRPCLAWCFYTLALVCGAYSFWQMTPISRWARSAILIAAVGIFSYYARQSVYAGTELDFFFVNPGVFIVADETGDWLLLVTGENTHKPLFNIQMILQDMVASRAIPNEPDGAKRVAMIRGSTIEKDYAEIGPTYLGDRIQWRPIDVNNQEYSIQARYRIGDKAFLSTEEIRIVNVGTRFESAALTDTRDVMWQFSVTVRNQSGDILMHCADPKFPHDAKWLAGPSCFPGAKYGPLPRSVCVRCFGHGFEYEARN